MAVPLVDERRGRVSSHRCNCCHGSGLQTPRRREIQKRPYRREEWKRFYVCGTLLYPGNTVLVDIGKKDIKNPGKIMLVTYPHDGSGKIKRVAIEEKNNDFRITSYSDNAANNPPAIFSFREDFNKGWNKVVAGHVCAWTDFNGK